MFWFWLWFFLLLGAIVLLGLLGWRVFRRGLAAFGELGRVTEAIGETNAASESAFDEWLLRRAEEDLADAERREHERPSSPPRRLFDTGGSSRRSPRVVR